MKDLSNKIKIIVRSIFVFLIFYYSAYFQYIPIKLLKLDVKHLSNSMGVILSTFSSLIVLIILLLIYRKDLKVEFKKFKDNLSDNFDIGVKYWMIGLFVMMISNFILNFVIKAGGANNEEAVQSMIKSLPWLMIIDAGIIAPINEELVFRKSIKDVFKNKYLFVLISFLIFGGAHVVFSSNSFLDYLYIIPYGALGAAFAMAYYESDTVFTSMSMHMIHNTLLILISIFSSFIF